MAAVKLSSGTFATPASRTNTLNGAGGGSTAGTSTASRPHRRNEAMRFSTRSARIQRRSSASPPRRARKYITRQPSTEPTVDAVAYRSHASGRCVTIQTMSRSFTCGSETNDESRNATSTRPGAPSDWANWWTALTKRDMQWGWRRVRGVGRRGRGGGRGHADEVLCPPSRPRVTRSHHIRSLLAATAIAAAALGLAAVWYYAALDLTLSHYDAKAHLVVARRIFDSLTPGWRQIGAVWLPLPHVLNALPVQVDAWYRDGTSGVAISVASFVMAAVMLVWLVQRTTGVLAAAVATAIVFVPQPDLLYLQATPMTEPLLLALMIGGVALLADWVLKGGTGAAWPAGLVLALACLTRYEAWPVTAAALVVALGSGLQMRPAVGSGLE